MFFVYFIAIGNNLYTLKNLESIKNEKIERYDVFALTALKKRMPNFFEDFNIILIDDKLLGEANPVFITESRVLVTNKGAKKVIEKALLKNRTAEILDGDSKANIIRLVVSNNSFFNHMSVFEIDEPIGKPEELSVWKKQWKKQILEEMDAF